MPLKLVLGPANSAKAGEVLGAFGAEARRGALLVVPTAPDALHYRYELAGQGVVLGSVVTFSGLAGEIARRVQYPGRRLTAGQREHAVRRAVSQIEFEAVRESAGGEGFRRAAGELIAELERALVTPQRFSAALEAWAGGDSARAAYARDLGRIYRQYARRLERLGRVDRELFAWRALDALRAAPVRWGPDPVFFYGFDELTALERDAVETLARVVGVPVTVSLTFEPGRQALVARADAVAELAPLADEVLELPALDEHYTPASRQALHHLERGLFEPGAGRLDPGPAIGLLEAGGARAEAELIAGQVLELLRAGVRADEIAVVYRSIDRVAPLVGRVFAQYGIGLAAAYELPFAHTPLGRAVVGAARCALNAPAARAANLLAYLRAPGVLERPELADGLEAELGQAGVTTAAGARQRLGWRLAELDALAAAEDPAAELARLARQLFAAPHRGQGATLDPAEELDARALGALIGRLNELAEIGVSLNQSELLELVEELPVAAGGGSGEGMVALTEPLGIRARRYRVVFVGGLQEGEFPLPASTEPFLSDERRRELAIASGLRLRSHEDTTDRERYLFYATVSRATERVVLSYRSSDEEGNLALPSPFVSDVAELLDPGWPERRVRRLLSDVVWPVASAPTAREQARAQAAASARAAGADPQPDRDLGALALGRLRHTEILSAGALETYADCPIKWLVERELRPEGLEPDSDAIVRGTLMHAVLERLLAALGGPLTEATLPRALQMLPGMLAELASSAGAGLGAGGPEVIRGGALRAIEADLRRYLEHDAASGVQWSPVGLELRFGFDPDEERGSLAALTLGDGSEAVRVRGMIDRVDADGAGHAVVRDYKSGAFSRDYPAARWSSERQLQVALYLLAVRQLTELEPVAGFYQPLRGEDLRGRGVFLEGSELDATAHPKDRRSRDEFEAELQDASQRTVTLAAALRSGHLEPCPRTCTSQGCAFPGICRSQ
jgi:ATP-dependent helicase/DNAse subunit B